MEVIREVKGTPLVCGIMENKCCKKEGVATCIKAVEKLNERSIEKGQLE